MPRHGKGADAASGALGCLEHLRHLGDALHDFFESSRRFASADFVADLKAGSLPVEYRFEQPGTDGPIVRYTQAGCELTRQTAAALVEL